jgi:hypothetical protein
MIGRAPSNAPAANTPHFWSNCPAVKICSRPSGIFVHVVEQDAGEDEVAVGADEGQDADDNQDGAQEREIKGSRRSGNVLAPSTMPDSSMARGMVSIKPFISQMLMPIEPPR